VVTRYSTGDDGAGQSDDVERPSDPHHHFHFHLPGTEDIFRQLGVITKLMERLMFDNTKLLASVARLEADDTAAIAALAALRDSNKQVAAQLADVSAQLAALKAGGDTAAVQAAVDAIADMLNADADAVEAAVAANPATPNLPPPAAPAAPAS
jgi:hypothetical protein